MINHPLTILQRTPAFAKPGLIPRNPPVQVVEGTCQVQGRQPVLIRYQIREVSGSRRTGAALLFLTDPKPLPASPSPSKHSPAVPLPVLACVNHPPFTPSRLSCHSLQKPSAPSTRPSRSRVRLLWQLAVLPSVCQQRGWEPDHVSPTSLEREKCPSRRLRSQLSITWNHWIYNLLYVTSPIGLSSVCPVTSLEHL